MSEPIKGKSRGRWGGRDNTDMKRGSAKEKETKRRAGGCPLVIYRRAAVCTKAMRLCLRWSTMGIVDDPKNGKKRHSCDTTTRRVTCRGEDLGCPCLLAFIRCGRHEVLVRTRPDRGHREGTTIRGSIKYRTGAPWPLSYPGHADQKQGYHTPGPSGANNRLGFSYLDILRRRKLRVTSCD